MHVHGTTLHHVGESTHVQDSPIMMLGGPERGSINQAGDSYGMDWMTM